MNMILAVMYRESRIRLTSYVWAFFDLVMPLTYLLLFGVGLDRTMSGGVLIEDATVSYQSFFLAGVLSMACFGIAINTSYGFFVDRDNGIFFEFLTYPMTRGEFLVGKIVFNCVLSLVQSILTITVGLAVLNISINWATLGLTAVAIVLGTAGWFFCLAVPALRVRRSDTYNTIINILYFALMFASSMFYPVDAMPPVLKWISYINPLTWHTDVLRYATIGIGNPQTILLEAVAFGTFLLIAFWFAVRALKYHVVE
jgi:ABC-2 type transport system permease protein